MTKHKTLQDRLARSLDQMNKNEAKTPKSAQAALPQLNNRKCKKLCISLFQTDLAKLDDIRTFMKTTGQWITPSQAIKLALRTAPHSTDLVEAMAAIQAEDGRTK
ncbi:MAG: hypothetical protein KKH28_00810 [Elusimicrobia bacterium]|nr:hypothetical protein [Elusimicrobiota bacterium]